MRVQLITQVYAPEPEIRYHLLAQRLSARGHQVEVITCFPNFPKGEFYEGSRPRPWRWEEDGAVRVLRLLHVPDHSPSGMRRLISYGSWGAASSSFGAVLGHKADVIFARHPPLTTGLSGAFLGAIRGTPFVLEIQDVWPEILTSTGMVNSPRVLRAVDRAMRFIYHRAAAVSVISPGFKRILVGKGVPETKVHVIYNWTHSEFAKSVRPDFGLAEQTGMAGRFNVVYAGNLGRAQALDNVLDAAALLRDLADVQFVLIGEGTELKRLQAAVAEMGLANVRFIGVQPLSRMPVFHALADVLLIHLSDDPYLESTVPGKTQASLAAGRPIIAAVGGDTADLVRQAGAGLVTRPLDPDGLARAVRELHAKAPEEREAMGAAGRRFFLENLSVDVLLDRFEELFTKVASGGRQATNR